MSSFKQSLLSILPRLNAVRSYLFVAMFLSAIIPLAVMIYNRVQTSYQREIARVEQSHLIIAKNLASTLDTYAVDAIATFNFLSSNNLELLEPSSVQNLMASYDFRYLATLKAGANQPLVSYERTFPDLAPARLDELKKIAASGTTKLTPVFLEQGEPFLFIVKLDGIGTLHIGAVDTSFVIAQQKKIAFGERGHSMIVDHEGHVLAHPKPEWVDTAKDASGLKVVQEMLAGNSGVMQFFAPPLKADVIAGYTSVSSTGWGVMVPQPISELAAAVTVQTKELLKLFALMLMFAGCISWVLSGLIVKPVKKISETVSEVRNGNSSARVRAFTGLVPSELTSMRQMFNALLQNWSESRSVLEAAIDAANEANSHKSKAIAVLSHEMRTPLNGLSGALELLDETNLDPKQIKLLKIAETSTAALLEHVNRVLEVSKLGSTNVTLSPVRLNVEELVRNLVLEHMALATTTDTEIDLNFADDVPQYIDVDKEKLRNVFANLISNAVKFTKAGTVEICLTFDQENQQLQLKVSDNGIGMLQEDLERIFEPFVVIDTEYARYNGGTGLGLSIVNKSLNALGGDVEVKSKIGKGTEFIVSLPVEVSSGELDEATIPQAAELASSKWQSIEKMNVLIVDDHEVNRIVLTEMLKKFGHSAVTASCGELALESAMAEPFDLILLDISMPEIDGTEVAELIRNQDGPNRTTPIWAQTANASAEDHTRFSQAGMQGVLVKPIKSWDVYQILTQQFSTLATKSEEQIPQDIRPFIDTDQFGIISEAGGIKKALKHLEDMLLDAEFVIEKLDGLSTQDATYDDQIAHVHRIAGACAMIGAVDLHHYLVNIELMLRRRSISDLSGVIERALQSISQTFQVSRRYTA